jgi:ABC-2 type transport system ATP-binding protein
VTPTPILELDGVEKRFTVLRRAGVVRRRRVEVTAVDHVSFTVAPGEMVGYIGPNGAGKSTTVKMLTGILVPSAGRIRACGLEPVRQRVQLARRIGVVFGQRTQLWWDLPLRESFELLRHIYRVPDAGHRGNLARFVEILDLGPVLDTPVRQLSLGQRMRGELTAALLHDPELVYLDEPTIGLDVVAKSAVRDFLAEVNRERGTTVLLTTHDLGDIERLCPRMLIIDHGRVIYDGLTSELASRYGGMRTLVVDLEEPSDPLELSGVDSVTVDGRRQRLTFSGRRVSAADLVAAVAARARIVDLAIEEPEIEEVVGRIYRQDLPVRPEAQGRPGDRAGGYPT